jgi:hypothetical protein
MLCVDERIEVVVARSWTASFGCSEHIYLSLFVSERLSSLGSVLKTVIKEQGKVNVLELAPESRLKKTINNPQQ